MQTDANLTGYPNLSEAWNQRAIAYGSEGEYAAAIEDCQEALEDS